MDLILHDQTNLPSVIIAIICEYCVFELDEKVKKLYLNYVNAKMKLPISKINPSTQLRYLNSNVYPMRIYEQLYINHISSKHIDFLLKNSHLVINAEHVFENNDQIYTSGSDGIIKDQNERASIRNDT